MSATAVDVRVVEEVAGEFGFTVVYHQEAQYAHVSMWFEAHKIDGRNLHHSMPLGAALYTSGGIGAETANLDEAEKFVSGAVKWDGCTNVDFHTSSCLMHLCGVEDIDRLAGVLRTIHQRCGELMRAAGGDLLEGEFQ